MEYRIKLSEVVEGFEMVSFENRAFIDRERLELVNIDYHYLAKAEDDEPYESMLDWEQELMNLAREIIENGTRYIELSKFDLDEYRMMERFCFTVSDPAKEEALLDAINGRGAFRRFKDLIHRLNIAGDWYDYRDEAYKQAARDFCDMHEIKYIE